MENPTFIIVVILVGILALFIAISLLALLFIGAIELFSWASEQGFIGVAVYFACWVFLLPFMITGCIILGTVSWWRDRQDR